MIISKVREIPYFKKNDSESDLYFEWLRINKKNKYFRVFSLDSNDMRWSYYGLNIDLQPWGSEEIYSLEINEDYCVFYAGDQFYRVELAGPIFDRWGNYADISSIYLNPDLWCLGFHSTIPQHSYFGKLGLSLPQNHSFFLKEDLDLITYYFNDEFEFLDYLYKEQKKTNSLFLDKIGEVLNINCEYCEWYYYTSKYPASSKAWREIIRAELGEGGYNE